MTIRTNVNSITFANPFVLRGLDEVLPAGTYEVETDEERVEGPSFPVYRRLRTVMQIPGAEQRPGSTRSILVEPDDLDAAIARDSTFSSGDGPFPDLVVEPSLPGSAPVSRRSGSADEGMRVSTTAAPKDLDYPSGREREQMEIYGITRIPIDYFHVGGYRYTNLEDAVAQAKRGLGRDEAAFQIAT